MLESISIRGCASFDDDGIHIKDLKKINFIYGANGTGKTTISNFLVDPTDHEYKDCRAVWEFSQQKKCLVYNKQFREKNFGNDSIEGVFTLGEATKEDIEAIERKQLELKALEDEGIKRGEAFKRQKEKITDVQEDFKENSWIKLYKKYENVFKEAFHGVKQKKLFKNKLLYEYENNLVSTLTFEELLEKSKIIFGDTPIAIQKLQTFSLDRIIEIEKDEIWETKIIGKSDVNISKMIQKLNINDWVNQGRSYIREDNICPFCQQKTITEDFRKELEKYFDETFIDSINKINELIIEYDNLKLGLLNLLTVIETNEKVNPLTNLNVDKFSADLKTLSSQFISNEELLKNKNREPSRSIKLVSTKNELESLNRLIEETNKKIQKHNDIVTNYQKERVSLIENIWKYCVEEFKTEIEKYNRKIRGLKTGFECIWKDLEKKRESYSKLDVEIKKLTQNVTSAQPTVDEINKTLKSYGFLNFEIVPSKKTQNHYQIKREDGTLAESTLSEGEITFITFLYFMQLAKGSTDEKSITDDRILIVDDPISSLDSNVLFVVSTLLKKVIQNIKADEGNIKQLFLFTHNVYFHKEVSFIDGRTNLSKDTHHWILRKKDKTSFIQAYKMKNPIQTSYELLWQELKDKEHNSGITIQNTMRRIIENYFKILGKYGDDALIKTFENQEEQEICRSLICWINDGSHSISDDLFIENQSETIDKYLKVFEDIFVLTNHKGHYDMMMANA